MDEIANKLLQATNDPHKHGTTVTITGGGGFGKTTAVISLCHHPLVKEYFTDGFVFIELGPQATDPSIKLTRLYHLLTGEDIKQGDINHAELEIKQLTSDYYRNLLVIIDDVWHVEDVEPLVKAFSNCKTILTTRMNDIEQYIPSQQSVVIGPMTQNEAISLLTSGVFVDSSQLSQEDVSLLDELAQDVHLWPLLLSLIRGHLSHNLKQYHLSYQRAIENIQAKLHDKGLTAFDKNNIESINRSRKLAVKACIELTLELLTNSLSDKIKILILWTGIGTSLQTPALHILWNISQQEATDTIDQLWAYGLVQFSKTKVSPTSIITQHCVEVHAVISQYIIDNMNSDEVFSLFPIDTSRLLCKGLTHTFAQSCGVHDPSSLTATCYLQHKLLEIENIWLPWYLNTINMYIVTDPHLITNTIQRIKDVLMLSPHTMNLLSLIVGEINSLIADCKKMLNDAHKLCRRIKQAIQRNLHEKKHDKIIQIAEEFIKHYPLCNIAQKAVTMVKQIMPYCNGQLLDIMIITCEHLQIKTRDYHQITTALLPHIGLYFKMHEQITSSLLNGSPDIESIYSYYISGKFDEESQLIDVYRLIKLQEVAPNFVNQEAKRHDNKTRSKLL